VTVLGGKCVVVTGASGFIGSAVVRRLERERGVRVVRLARTLEHTVDSFPVALEDLDRDVWRDGSVDRIDALFHLGGYIPKTSNAGLAIESNFTSNLTGTRRLLESLPNAPDKIVFASSVDVYARTSDTITEASRVDPGTLYGASKLFLEKLVELYARENSVDATILRLGHTYGPGEGAFDKIIPKFIRTLLARRDPIINGDGSLLRDYLYVSDAAEAFARAGNRRDVPGPLNVVSGRSVSLRDLAALLVELTGYAGEIRYAASQGVGTSFRFDNAEFISALGELALVPLRTGLAAEIESFRQENDV
jgi:UDP-glucose 4-epimerase